MSTPSRRRGRPTKDDARLTAEHILRTALARVDADGLAALSMRRLARELEVDPMSIYHHVPGKAALVSGMVELVFSRMRLPEAGGDSTDADWADRVRAWVRAYHDLARAHPHLVLEIVTDPAAVARAGAIIEEPLEAALRAGGVPANWRGAAIGLLVDYVNGFALAEVGAGDPARPAPEDLEQGLDIVIRGLRAIAAHPSGGES